MNTVRSLSRRARFAQGGLHIFGLLNQHAHVAIGFCQFHEVWQGIHVAVAVTARILNLLPLPHHTQVTVVQGHDFDRGVVLQASGQLLNTHLHRALTRDTKHFAVGLGQFDAHGVGNAHAHGAQTT